MNTSRVKDLVAEISGLEHRLLACLDGKISTDLQSPDKTGIKNKKKKQGDKNVSVTMTEMIEDLIHRIIVNVLRETENSIISLRDKSLIYNGESIVELSRQLVEKILKNISREVSIGHIQQEVCNYFQISTNEMLSQSRKHHIVVARRTSMYFVKKYSKLSLEKVGIYCGNRDHATVLYALQEVEKQKNENIEYSKHLEAIDNILQKTLNQ